MLASITDKLIEKLGEYRFDAESLEDPEAINGSRIIAATVARLIDALTKDDSQRARLECLTFSRQVSDAYFTHPPTMKDLSEAVQQLRNALK